MHYSLKEAADGNLSSAACLIVKKPQSQIETTRVYAYADTEMKRKAIQKANSTIPDTVPEPIWKTNDKEMIRKLAGLK